MDSEEVAYLERIEERTQEQRERYWRQLEQEWPQFVRNSFPSPPNGRDGCRTCHSDWVDCEC